MVTFKGKSRQRTSFNLLNPVVDLEVLDDVRQMVDNGVEHLRIAVSNFSSHRGVGGHESAMVFLDGNIAVSLSPEMLVVLLNDPAFRSSMASIDFVADMQHRPSISFEMMAVEPG